MQEDEWERFVSTGRIEDYLLYSRHRQPSGGEETGGCRAGENPHAGVYQCNRNHIETDAYRGI